jgi:hypothetical protein
MDFRTARLRSVIAVTGVALFISPFINIPGGAGAQKPQVPKSNSKSPTPSSSTKSKSPTPSSSTNVYNHFFSQLFHGQLPVRLKIPSIKVNAAIRNVGLTATVNSRADVAWYDLGPRPGE